MKVLISKKKTCLNGSLNLDAMSILVRTIILFVKNGIRTFNVQY